MITTACARVTAEVDSHPQVTQMSPMLVAGRNRCPQSTIPSVQVTKPLLEPIKDASLATWGYTVLKFNLFILVFIF